MKLSIIIPCKNEERYIGKLFSAIQKQRLPKNVEIIVADADSTDKTPLIISAYSHVLPIKKVSGGLPSVGRNNGAEVAKGDVLLFLDADTTFEDPELIRESLIKIQEGNELVGALLSIKNNSFIRFLYFLSNMVMRFSKLEKPFVVGAYFMITKEAFERLGGFDESLMHCEDYFLSREISNKKFAIINKYIYTDDRRFKKMGKLGMARYFFFNILQRNNKKAFKKDIGYWS